MSINTYEKLSIMRESEWISRNAVCDLTGISYNSLTDYELDRAVMGLNVIQKFLGHSRC